MPFQQNSTRSNHIMETKDCDGNLLETGDTIKTTKDLPVKGTKITVKQGQTVKKIRVTDDPGEIDCKIDGTSVTLKTCFVRKQKDKKKKRK